MSSTMSSSSSSMSFIHCLFLVITLVLILQQTAEANHNIIQEECQNAENPTICIECLQSLNSSQNASPEKIAAHVLGCLRKHVHNVALGFSHLSTTIHDNDTSLALKKCHKLFAATIAAIVTAIKKAIAGDFAGAQAALVTAIVNRFKCHFKLDLAKGAKELPIDFKYEMLSVDQLFDAATRIVERRL